MVQYHISKMVCAVALFTYELYDNTVSEGADMKNLESQYLYNLLASFDHI